MANIFYDTGGNFSELIPKKVVAGAYAPVINYNTVDALNTTRYQAFTASEGGDMEGAFLCLRNISTTGTNSVTCTLQEDPGTGFADVAGATKTLTVTEMAGAHTTTLLGAPMWVYFKFATPATITTAASRWRLKVSATTANQFLYQTYGYGVVLTATTTYSSGDNIFVDGGVIITQDQSVTATNLMVGVNTHWLVPSTVAASYALTVTYLWFSKDFRLALGEDDAHRIPYANQFTLTVTNWKNGDGYQGAQNFELEMWGEKPTNYFTLLNANVAATQKTLVTTTDMSASWVNGETLIVTGRSSATQGYESMVLDTISGTSITCTLNFAAIHYSGWAVINATRAVKCGIVLDCGSIGYNYHSWAVIKLSGVHTGSNNINLLFNNTTSTLDTTRILPRYLDTFIMSGGAGIGFNEAYPTSAVRTILTNQTFKYVFMWGGTTSKYTPGLRHNDFYGGYINNIYISTPQQLFGGTISLTAKGTIISDIQSSGCYPGLNYPGVILTTTGCTIDRLKILGGGNSLQLVSVATTITTGSLDYSTNYGIYIVGSTLNTTFKDFNLGQDYVNANDTYVPSGYFEQILFNNCKFSAGSKEAGNIAGATLGSYIRAMTYGTTANDHRSWWVYGNMVSTGDGLTDTTVHTSGSGKFAIRFEPTSSTNNLTWQFDVPTGNIQNKTMTVAVWCKINSATYYAGTHQLPRLTIDYDNGTTAYSQATASTDWQLLHVTFTPTTTYGQITVTLSGRTDATTTDAYIYWDDISILYPASVALDLGGLDNWANALPVTPPVAIPISAYTVSNAVWEELTNSHTTTGSLGKKLGSLKNPSLIIDGEIIV